MTPRPRFPNACWRLIAAGVFALGMFSVVAPPLRAQATHTASDWAQAPGEIEGRDSLRNHLARLRSALLGLRDRPEQAQPLQLTARATAESRSGVRRLRIRNFQLLSEEKIEQLQRAVEAACPIYNMLKEAQEIKGSIVRGPYREKSR